MASIKPEIITRELVLSFDDPKRIAKATLEFYGINHAGPSFEARIFLNNKKANEKTAKTDKAGYAGSFFIFGHGGKCYGGPGHCAVPPKDTSDPYDIRRSHPLTPTFRYVVITKQLKKLAKKGKITVTIVPIPRSYNEMADFRKLLQFEKLSLITYDR